MSDSCYNLTNDSPSENTSNDTDSNMSKIVAGDFHQDDNMNGVSSTTSASLTVNNTMAQSAVTESAENSTLPSPMDVDEVENELDLNSPSAEMECSVQDASKKDDVDLSLLPSMMQNQKITNGDNLDGISTSLSPQNNTDSISMTTNNSFDNDASKCDMSNSNTLKYDASKYSSSSGSSSTSQGDTNSLRSLKDHNDLKARETGAIKKKSFVVNRSVSSDRSKDTTNYNSNLSDNFDQENGLKNNSRPFTSNNNSSASASLVSQASKSATNTSDSTMQQPKPSETGKDDTVSASCKQEPCQVKFRKNPMNNIEKALAMHTTEHFGNTSSASDTQGDCSICLSDGNEESPYQSDAETARDLVGCVKLQQCDHLFHTTCLLQSLSSDGDSICCPNCKTIHGTMTGTQPKGGKMIVRVNSYSLPGHNGTKTIAITYSFPSGIQGPEHPSPGRPYYLFSFPRTAYLPDTPQGRKVLRLLREAFKRRLIFTVGTSATLGQSDCVVWNGIHHKTETTNRGGHGYPDPNYLDNVTMELAAVGVTEDSCSGTDSCEDDRIDYSAGLPNLHHRGASGMSSSHGGASGMSPSHGGASGMSSSHGGASGMSSSHGGASGVSSSYGGGSLFNPGGATGLNISSNSSGNSSGILNHVLSRLPGRNKTTGDGLHYQYHSSGGDASPRQIKFRAKPKDSAEKLLATCSVEVPAFGISDVQCCLCRHALGSEGPSQNPRLTQRDIVGAVMLGNCGHSFHCCCLFLFLKTASRSFRCPLCGAFHGTLIGTQPTNGKMIHKTENFSLPGHEDCKTIVITYYIPRGIQGREHPNPGLPYDVRGFPRTAFLPDSPKGRKVLKLLKKAFERRLVFTVGYSVYRGEHNCVTWAQISHKTCVRDGEFGYPDPKYLDNVLLELAALGVTEHS